MHSFAHYVIITENGSSLKQYLPLLMAAAMASTHTKMVIRETISLGQVEVNELQPCFTLIGMKKK